MTQARIVYSELLEHHGTVDGQKERLINTIVESFSNPQEWPMTDVERIELLKTLFVQVSLIKRTEAARVNVEKGSE